MFSTDSIIKDVNIIVKTMCYIIILISLILIKQPIFIIFINLFLLVITKQYKEIFKINIILLMITFLSIFYQQFLWITKILILLIYTLLLKKVTKTYDLRYLLESTLYRFQKRVITYKILYLIYFGKYFKENINKMFLLKNDYNMKFNISFIIFILKQSYLKTKEKMNKFMITNKIRFYNYSNVRTYLESPSFESWDVNYIIIHIILLLLVCVYGR